MRAKAAVVIATSAVLGLAQPANAGDIKLQAEPIVRLSDGRIAACGVSFAGLYNGAEVRVEFMLVQSPVGPVFRLTGRYQGSEQLADIALETDFASTVGLMPRPRAMPDGSLEVQTGIPGYNGSEFVRSLMVSGGRVRLGLAGPTGNVVDIDVPGPLSQQVRASYLNCAGDIERP